MTEREYIDVSVLRCLEDAHKKLSDCCPHFDKEKQQIINPWINQIWDWMEDLKRPLVFEETGNRGGKGK